MQTECISPQLEFEGFGKQRVVAAFDGGAISSDAGLLLLCETDRVIGLENSSVLVERGEGGALVLPHQARIARHISGKDRG